MEGVSMTVMDGYIKNIGRDWAYVFKQGVKPGAIIDLNSLYESYGKKNNLKPGDEFLAWIKNVKLKGRDGWQVVFNNPEEFYEEISEAGQVEGTPIIENTETVADQPKSVKKDIIYKTPRDMEVSDLANMTIKQAREVLPMITDIKKLKYSLKLAKPRAHSDTLCILLEKRIREVEVMG